MSPLKILIAGDGPLALLAARIAASRGYSPTLLSSSSPASPFLMLGNGGGEPGGLLSALLAEAGLPPPKSRRGPHTAQSAVFLYLGRVHRLLGCPLPVAGLTPEEEARFFPGLGTLSGSVFPELENRMDQSYRASSTFFPLGKRIMNWILEPERKKEHLPSSIKKIADSVLEAWRPLLDDFKPFAGVSSRKTNDPELLRAIMHLASARARIVMGPEDILLGDGGPVSPSSIHRIERGEAPVVLGKSGRHGQWSLLAKEPDERSPNIFDRVLSLTGEPVVRVREMSCSFDPSAIPAHWPSSLLLSEGTRSSLLILPPTSGNSSGGRARMVIAENPGGEGPGVGKQGEDRPEDWPEDWTENWIGRWNRQSLFPFLRPGSGKEPRILPLLKPAPGEEFSPKRKTSHLSQAGHVSVLTDPSRLPVLPEDWLADLSMALPARKPSP